ncbi:kinase-like protein [Amniculicola lignicola CBS 123094]|uniref:non-specific serine/threonine protein kinase n=1 Tax=Amniculicola lignicola CBS 123094 TaxID=1392246 RepID=A0A6A5WJA1_9PLEO|nr:kinase-like protein [Amniculicola lignicola CBS 123094]
MPPKRNLKTSTGTKWKDCPVRVVHDGGGPDEGRGVEPPPSTENVQQSPVEQNELEQNNDRALGTQEIIRIYRWGKEEVDVFMEHFPNVVEPDRMIRELFQPYVFGHRLQNALDINRIGPRTTKEIGRQFFEDDHTEVQVHIDFATNYTIFLDYSEEVEPESDEFLVDIYGIFGKIEDFRDKLSHNETKRDFEQFVIGVQLDRLRRLDTLCSHAGLLRLWSILPEDKKNQAIAIAANHPDPRSQEEADAAHIFDLDNRNREYCQNLPYNEQENFRWLAIAIKDIFRGKAGTRFNPDRIVPAWEHYGPQTAQREEYIEYGKLQIDPRTQFIQLPDGRRPVPPPSVPASPPDAHVYREYTRQDATEPDIREVNQALHGIGRVGEWHFVKCIYVNPGHNLFKRTVHLFVRVSGNYNLEERLVVKIQGYTNLARMLRDSREYDIHHLLSVRGSDHIVDLYGRSVRARGHNLPPPEPRPPFLGYIYMQYAPFGDLMELADSYRSGQQSSTNMPEIFLWILLRGFAEALHTMRTGNLILPTEPMTSETPLNVRPHWQPVVHLDIKPQNFVLGDSSQRYPAFKTPKLIDFGLAMRENLASDNWPTPADRQGGWTTGTQGFRPPEYVGGDRAHGTKPIGEKTELWTVAWTILLLMHKRGIPDRHERPARGKNLTLVYRPYGDDVDMYSHALFDLVRRCLEVDPAKRPTLVQVLYETRIQLEKHERRWGGFEGKSSEDLLEFFRVRFKDDEFAAGGRAPKDLRERVKRRRGDDAEDEDDESQTVQPQANEPQAEEAQAEETEETEGAQANDEEPARKRSKRKG